MKMKKITFMCLCMSVILASCGNSPSEQTPQPSPLPVFESPMPAPSPSPEIYDEHEAKILRIMAAGKAFIKELQNGTVPSNMAEGHEGNAPEIIGRFFDVNALYVSGAYIDPHYPDGGFCFVSATDELGLVRSFDILFQTVNGKPMQWFCNLVSYADQSDRNVRIYLDYLEDGNADGLAQWRSIDISPSEEMIASANNALAYYQDFYDLSELTVREDVGFKCTLVYDGSYNAHVEGFQYSVNDANGTTFQVRTRFGDGFCYPILDYRG